MTFGIIGGGISGLTAAYQLKSAGFEVILFESSEHLGGKIHTIKKNKYAYDVGPNTVIENNNEFVDLIERLGLNNSKIKADESAATRFILSKGKLKALPTNPLSFLFGNFFSISTKLKILTEPFKKPVSEEESVAGFFKRRFSKELVELVINPFVAGTYASRPEELSVEAGLFKRLKTLEREYGSIIKGFIQDAKKQKFIEKRYSGKMISFDNGIYRIIERLGEDLGDSIQLHQTVSKIDLHSKYYTLHYGAAGKSKQIDLESLIIATPAKEAASLFGKEVHLRKLSQTATVPVAQVFFSFNPIEFTPQKGFGFLIPENENAKILGAVFNSHVFPERYSNTVISVFIGGSRQPHLALLAKDELEMLALTELQRILGFAAKPKETESIQWREAIPQYTVGYRETLQEVEKFEEDYQGIYFCGNWKGAISVPDAIAEAIRTANKAVAKFNSSSEKKVIHS
ncbi:MAG: protoporphyrinogen oxidase [Chloroherpetonaceae bacterium]|nr:protoporphyrinogen oxidase [Chloroherpetonaceae bacterium]